MTLTLDLSPELEARLKQEATRQGLALEVYAVDLLNRSLPLADDHIELITLLQGWMDEEDGGEQRETGDHLIHALDEERLADRPLFPENLKGRTW